MKKTGSSFFYLLVTCMLLSSLEGCGGDVDATSTPAQSSPKVFHCGK
ncbi:hypothetical protein [Burkholderia sp. GS2Y]|uniref:Lipoprotein n=1 Tax=Burkholderia theae TaxID=3143496 RepID=A0ABU9WI99_9BURK